MSADYPQTVVMRGQVRTRVHRSVPFVNESIVFVYVEVEPFDLPRNPTEVAAFFASFPADAQVIGSDEPQDRPWLEIHYEEPSTDEDRAKHRAEVEREAQEAADLKAFEAWKAANRPPP